MTPKNYSFSTKIDCFLPREARELVFAGENFPFLPHKPEQCGPNDSGIFFPGRPVARARVRAPGKTSGEVPIPVFCRDSVAKTIEGKFFSDRLLRARARAGEKSKGKFAKRTSHPKVTCGQA